MRLQALLRTKSIEAPIALSRRSYRRLKSSPFFAANSASVRMFFWRRSESRSIVVNMSSVEAGAVPKLAGPATSKYSMSFE
jgi:hypothetical protein